MFLEGSGGGAILARKGTGISPGAAGLIPAEATHRLHVAWIDAIFKGGVHGFNVYLRHSEGLSDAKLVTLETYMHDYGIHILCLQEVRKPLSDCSITENGYLLICSGGDSAVEYAGVGFLIHPMLRKHIHNFCQYSNRIAGVKIRTPGGKIAVV